MAATEKLNIVITVADQTKGALSGVAGNIQKVGKAAGLAAVGGIAALSVGVVKVGSDALGVAIDRDWETMFSFSVAAITNLF